MLLHTCSCISQQVQQRMLGNLQKWKSFFFVCDVCLSDCPSFVSYLYVICHLSICLSVCLFACLFNYLSFYIFACLTECLLFCMFAYYCLLLSTTWVLNNGCVKQVKLKPYPTFWYNILVIPDKPVNSTFPEINVIIKSWFTSS